jgi:GTP-binding protein
MIDRAEIKLKAGDGGDGVVGFRREMYAPYGGPDGGDGGRGGDVIIRATEAVDSLRRYRQKKTYRAGDGRDGQGRNKTGKNGENLLLEVPPGTMVTETVAGEKVLISDLENAGEKVVVAKGGKGGWGNTRYKSSVNQAPRIAQRGEAGEVKTVSLDMKMIADVGVIGYPNAGKSTMLAAVSKARPKAAGYPFTTLEPVPGVVEIGIESFVIAEIPGLIEGAHLGRGLGHDFLRHAQRTKVLIHLLDGTSAAPEDDMMRVNRELDLYDLDLARKTQIVVLNKIDLPEVQAKLDGIKSELFVGGIKAHEISAATGQGVDELMKEVMLVLKTETEKVAKITGTEKVFRPRLREPRVSISREGDEYIVAAPGLERIKGGAGISAADMRWELSYQFKRLGVDKALEKAGAKAGDKIRCGEFTWEWAPAGGGK